MLERLGYLRPRTKTRSAALRDVQLSVGRSARAQREIFGSGVKSRIAAGVEGLKKTVLGPSAEGPN